MGSESISNPILLCLEGASCDKDEVTISDVTFHRGTVYSCSAATSISTQSAVSIRDCAEISLSAPSVEMNGGFQVMQRGLLQVNPEIALTHGNRLRSSNLIYAGAFRLPDEFDWGARGMSYYPAGNSGEGSLLITAFQGLRTANEEQCFEGSVGCFASFAEVAIPVPEPADNWETLPVATLLRNPTVFDGGLVASVHEAYSFVSGIQYVAAQGTQMSDKIYGSLNEWYPEGSFGNDSFPTVWFSELDGTNAQGMFHVGPTTDPLYHGRKMGEYLFDVPSWFANRYLGGRTLVTGRSRGSPANLEAITTAGGSQGPTLFAFMPWRTNNPSGNLDAIPMLYYRVKYPGCSGPDVGVGGKPTNCDYPGFSMCDAWNGGSFVEHGGRHAIMLIGHKGCSNCYYCDETAADSECHAKPLPGECERRCDESRGYHCGPYRRQVIFYDVEELGQAALGNRNPWTVLPYENWKPTEFYFQTVNGNNCEDVGGMTFDTDGARIFMVERGFGGYGNSNAAVVHVWTLSVN